MPILCTFFNEALENGELGIDARGLSSTDCHDSIAPPMSWPFSAKCFLSAPDN